MVIPTVGCLDHVTTAVPAPVSDQNHLPANLQGLYTILDCIHNHVARLEEQLFEGVIPVELPVLLEQFPEKCHGLCSSEGIVYLLDQPK